MWMRRISALGFWVASSMAQAASSYNLPYGVTSTSQQIYRLHMITFAVCCVIAVLVYGVLFYALMAFRRSKHKVAANFHEHLGVEILWTVIPALILVALAVPATRTLMHIHNTEAADINIKVVGYQWKWRYEYLDQGIDFFSNLSTSMDQIEGRAEKDRWFLLEVDHPMVVPIHKKIRLLVTSNDVIHAWWVPELGVKQDAVPGYINENWMKIEKPGIYRGQCGELCGARHGFMPVVVKAVTQAEFDRWVAQQKQPKKVSLKALSPDALLKQGKSVYNKVCAMCHQPTGMGLPPTFPALKGSAVAVGPASKTIDTVMNGVSGSAMQAFSHQLNTQELAAVISYVRHAWGNDKLNQAKKQPVLVQPQQLHASKK